MNITISKKASRTSHIRTNHVSVSISKSKEAKTTFGVYTLQKQVEVVDYFINACSCANCYVFANDQGIVSTALTSIVLLPCSSWITLCTPDKCE